MTWTFLSFAYSIRALEMQVLSTLRASDMRTLSTVPKERVTRNLRSSPVAVYQEFQCHFTRRFAVQMTCVVRCLVRIFQDLIYGMTWGCISDASGHWHYLAMSIALVINPSGSISHSYIADAVPFQPSPPNTQNFLLSFVEDSCFLFTKFSCQPLKVLPLSYLTWWKVQKQDESPASGR